MPIGNSFHQYRSEKSIDLVMFSNVNEKYLASFDNQLEHYPVTDVDGYGRQATKVSLETVEPQGKDDRDPIQVTQESCGIGRESPGVSSEISWLA